MTDICDALRPLYVCQNWLGLRTFSVSGPYGSRVFEPASHLGPYKIAFYTFMALVLGVDVVIDHIYVMRTYEGVLVYVMTFDLFSNILLILLMVVFNEAHAKTSVGVWTESIRIDVEMREMGIVADDASVKRFAIALIAAYVALIAFAFLYFDLAAYGHFLFHVGLCDYFLSHFYKSLLQVSFCCQVYLLRSRFRALSDFCLVNSTFQAKTAELHQDLAGLAATVNRIHSVPLLLNIASNFFMLVTETFRLCRFVYAPGNASVTPTILLTMACVYAIDVVTVVGAAAVLTHDANAIKRSLLKVFNRVYREGVRREINGFALQLLHYEVTVSAGGFFVLDFVLVYSMIGAVTTYLVILVQFDLAMVR